MKHSNHYLQQFAVDCPNALDLDGKGVAFQFQEGHELIPYIGTFQVVRAEEPGKFLVDIDNPRFVHQSSPASSHFQVHLSQPDIASLVPAKPNDLGVDYEVTHPFLSRHRIPDIPNRQDAS